MEIRQLDLTDDALMRRVALVADRVRRHGRAHAGAFDQDAWVAEHRATESGEKQLALVALDGDEPLGFAFGYVFLLDNRDLGWLEVQVDVTSRGLGVGDALLEELVRQVRAEGRTTMLAESIVPFAEQETHPHRRFLERHGFSWSNVEVVRHQQLPVPEESLVAWESRAAERASAYRIESFVGPLPEELRESLCTLLGLLGVDAPTGAVDFEEEVVTPQRLAERYANAAAAGREIVETVAISPDGLVVAQSTIAVPLRTPEAQQWGTYVHREHRGHALGLAVKVANLRAVQSRFPHVTRVDTQNAETNEWMIAINEEMGYAPVEAALELVRRF